MSVEAPGLSRSRTVVAVVVTTLLFDSAWLYIANHASGPPRLQVAAVFYEGALLLHLTIGLAALGWFCRRIRRLWAVSRGSVSAVFGRVALVALAGSLATGLTFLPIGLQWLPIGTRHTIEPLHDVTSAVAVLAALAWLWLRPVQPSPQRTSARRLSLKLGIVLGAPLLALYLYTAFAPNTDRSIHNPALAPASMELEGDGATGKFFPASAQTVDGQFFPKAYFIDSKTCGARGCHPDIYRQWSSSAHHFASFNNQWYRKSIEYMQDVIGTKPSQWCGGCHDMAVLLTQDPHNPGKSRFGLPIANQDWPPEQYPWSHAGIGCAVCHSIVHVKSTMGNNDYLADYPPMHKVIMTQNPLLHGLYEFLTRIAPEPHAKTFLRPFHVDDTAKFCSACHKVHLDVPVNDYRWFRGFDEYDAWQSSGVSGFGAASFYYPVDPKSGGPAFKTCADCHMPLVASGDAGNIEGFVHSHRFPAANTALPFVNHDKKQLDTVTKFLTDKALSVDIFAIRRSQQPKPKVSAPRPAPQGYNGLSTTSGMPLQAPGATDQDQITAPINRGAVLHRGEDPLVDVVVRTLKMGHAFPGGTFDAFDVWVELIAKESNGHVIYHSGSLQWKNGPVEPGAEQYRALLIDKHGHIIDKRNAWAERAVVYAKAIPPGAADVVHFRIPIPKNCGNSITLTAKLNYRKFSWRNTWFAYASRTPDEPKSAPNGLVPTAVGVGKTSGPVAWGWDDRKLLYDADLSRVSGKIKAPPVLPIIVLAQNSVTIPVVAAGAHAPVHVTPPNPPVDRIRWNDYGIGLLLQGDLSGAKRAFHRVIALSPQWPEGWVNLGRADLAESDAGAAISDFNNAFTRYAAHATPMNPWLIARTRFFYARAQFELGQLRRACGTLRQVTQVFPQDRNVRNLYGEILFRLGNFPEAVRQFLVTTSIDPENATAHYNLMKCFRGEGNMKLAAVHEELYNRFKADELSTALAGNYLRKHPNVNNLAQPIHEHATGISRPPPAWYVRWLKQGYPTGQWTASAGPAPQRVARR
ncbi:MAG: tetratricopeptide repeat protein [Armatimonadetes bacterium]|nr:tetratricopeptide repeat protein [Armatimonadota bacterium]MDE2207374.1 tetratricopeptide repeat protein [Armatimonadota bacterium]